jgi:DNA-directed RNA polymerase subunit M/transcription elongation factor TFIIS
MDCPQCGTTLATYALDGREATVCEDCGYVGIAAEHRGEPRRIESWNEALRRFYRAHERDAAPSVDLRPPLSRPSDGDRSETWDDALRRFYERQASPETGDEESGTETAADGDETTEERDESAAAEESTTRPSQSSAGDS